MKRVRTITVESSNVRAQVTLSFDSKPDTLTKRETDEAAAYATDAVMQALVGLRFSGFYLSDMRVK
jgi:hypothetical protein